MTVSYTAIEAVDELTWRIAFASDRAAPVSFYVYDEGVLVETIDSRDGTGEYLRTVMPGASPFVEVLDRSDQLPAIAFPARMTLAWLAVDEAVGYRVQELVDAEWTQRGSLQAGPRSFTWLTRPLEDCRLHRFRVLAIDSIGNPSTPLELSAVMVRIPDAPNATISYDQNTQTLQVA